MSYQELWEVKALDRLKPSKQVGLDFAVEKVDVPLAQLPSEEVLIHEIAVMEDFIRRANDGDENTLECVGLNFPRELTPVYRGRLIESVLPWNRWALKMRRTDKTNDIPEYLEMELYVIRVGDVGIVGMPCEPFQGIGRQIRRESVLPLTIPCGYVNCSHSYITDAENTGDTEYISAYYRYTKFRAPLKIPAGDVLAKRAAKILNNWALANSG